MSDPLSLLGPTQSMSLEKDLSEVEVLKRENEKLQRRVTQLEVQKEGSVGRAAV